MVQYAKQPQHQRWPIRLAETQRDDLEWTTTKTDGLLDLNGRFISAVDVWGLMTGTGRNARVLRNSTMDESFNLYSADCVDSSENDCIYLEDDSVEQTGNLTPPERSSNKSSYQKQRTPAPVPQTKPTNTARQNHPAPINNHQSVAKPVESGEKQTALQELLMSILGLSCFYCMYLGFRWLYSDQVVTPPQRPQTSIISASSKAPSIQMPVASDPTQQLTNLSGKIEQWKIKRDKLAKILSTLEVDKNKTAASLRKLGANAEDIKSSDPKAATLLVELQDILRQIVNFDKKRIEYDLAIFKSESRLRTLERRLAALDLVGTDEELSALFSSIAEIDQELDAESANEIPVEFDELITKTLRDSTSGETGVVE